jgi:hypothetical protein
MQNVEQTVISQYGNSSAIGQLIQGMNTNIDPTLDIDGFYNAIFNIDTATGYGLGIWSRIVGLEQSVLATLSLTDDQLRSLVLLKALSNISFASAPSINQLLQNWLGGGVRAYVQDLGKMQMSYVFEFELEPYQLAILQNSGIFLRPSGVLSTIIATSYPVFGFKEMGTEWAMGFGQAPFATPGAE